MTNLEVTGTAWAHTVRRVRHSVVPAMLVPRRVSMVSVESLETCQNPPAKTGRDGTLERISPAATATKRPLAASRPPAQNDHTTPTPPTPRNYLERIPVAGLYNYLYAQQYKERCFWAVILLVSTAFTALYLTPGIAEYLKQTTVLEVRHPTEPRPPFPIVYVGVIDGINGTYINGRFAGITSELEADKRRQQLARNRGWTSQQMTQLAITYMTTSPLRDLSFLSKTDIHTLHEVIYRSVLAFGSNWTGINTFYDEGMYRCPQVLRNCELNGIEFPCCHDGTKGYHAEISVFYKMNMSAVFGEYLERSLSGDAHLTFESTIDTRYALPEHPEYPILSISFGNTLATLFDAAGIGVPAGMAAFIKLRSRQRNRVRNCIDRYEFDPKMHTTVHDDLIQYIKNMSDPVNYSIEKCTFVKMLEMLSTTCGCVAKHDTLRPNDTSICTPAHLYVCFHGAFESNVKVPVSHGESKDLFVHLKEQASDCLPLCDSWDYDVHVTYVPLGGEAGSKSAVITGKVVITVDSDYRLESDVLKFTRPAFLATLGDGLAVFLGMSLVTFIQGAYWLIAAVALHSKRKKVGPKQGSQS